MACLTGYLIGRSSFVNIINFKLNVSSFYKPHKIQAAELLLKDKNLFFFVVNMQSSLVSTIQTIIQSPHLLCLSSLELGGLSRRRGLTIIVHYISDIIMIIMI